MQLHIENFDGPLDVLLHLISTQKINVFDIPVIHITEQYLAFLAQAIHLDFDEAGAYLAMAAQLIELKARMLLPALQNKISHDAESLDDIPPDDPRRPLVEKLLELEALKEAAARLEIMSAFGRDTFPSGESKRRADEFEQLREGPLRGDAFSLAIAFERVLLRFSEQKELPTVKIRSQKVTIHKRMIELKEHFHLNPEASFEELTTDCTSRYDFIVTIMAVLELCKSNHLELVQAEMFGPIRLHVSSKFGEIIVNPDGERQSQPESER